MYTMTYPLPVTPILHYCTYDYITMWLCITQGKGYLADKKPDPAHFPKTLVLYLPGVGDGIHTFLHHRLVLKEAGEVVKDGEEHDNKDVEEPVQHAALKNLTRLRAIPDDLKWIKM